MFEAGHVVTYRELWAGEVMTALPMRLIADTGDVVVLYLAPETDFQAARAPDGGRVRDLDDWVSVPQTWTGGSLVRIVPRDHWYAVDLEYDAERAFIGYYVNFQEPLHTTAQGFDTVDLVLDLVVDPDGESRMKDEDDFADAVSAGHIDTQTAELLRTEAARLLRVVERDGSPTQAQEWLAWRPPSEWDVPTLVDGWQEVRA